MDFLSNLKNCCSPPKRNNSDLDAPYTIITDFNSITEKECGKKDAENEKKYANLLNKADKAAKTIENSGLSMSLEVPPPPHPCNRDRYIIWKKRNVSKKVIPQSEAIFFLTQRKLVLNKDYEAYQAINLAEDIKKDEGILEPAEDKSIQFNDVYSSRDKNIYRRRSMYRKREKRNFYPSLDSEEEVEPEPKRQPATAPRATASQATAPRATASQATASQATASHLVQSPEPLPLPYSFKKKQYNNCSSSSFAEI
jgi:hypothetical protein